MPIQVTCSECSTTQSVGNEKAGLRLRCRNCGAVVAIPALEPGAAAKTGKTARSSPLAPLVRPVIYSLVGVFAVAALLFRWWFNPPRPVPPRPIDVTVNNQTGNTP